MMPHDSAALVLLSLPVLWLLLYTGHRLADHWLQTTHQAAHKDIPAPIGIRACASHVGVLLAIQAGAHLIAAGLGAHITLPGAAAGLALQGITHYWADRRAPLAALATALRRAEFARFGTGLGSGAYALDQDWHRLWLVPSALLAVAPTFGFGVAVAVPALVLLGAAIIASRIGARIDADAQAAAGGAIHAAAAELRAATR